MENNMVKHKKRTDKQINKKPLEKQKITYLKQINPFVAGIDIGSKSHFVAAPVSAATNNDDLEICVREFSTFTSDLEDLANWLKECQVTSVAMESTGVYWIPLFELLESRDFEVYLVDARHVKNVTGRKSDVKDCQWIQQLHACGLLSPAFRPDDKILPLRSYTRQRDALLENAASCTLRMQKALTQMNLHLRNVLSDITGLTGMQIIRAIVNGERDPKKLAKMRDPRCKNPIDVIEKSLTGNYREEHLFSLQQALESYDFYQQQIFNCDQKIESALVVLNSDPIKSENRESENIGSDKGQNSKPKPNQPRTYKPRGGNILYFNPLEHLQSILGVDLTKIPGIEGNLAVKILSEIGTDMKKWKTSKHFTSWLGLSPENKVSGGKRLSSKTKPSANRAALFFRMAAFSLFESQTALGGFLRRMKAKLGAPKAITATARKIASLFYSMLVQGTDYVEAGLDYYDKQYKERVLKGLEKRATHFGYTLTPLIPPASCDKGETAYA
jgi:transposase